MKYVLLALTILSIISIAPAYADSEYAVVIQSTFGSAVSDCVDKPVGCFYPATATVQQGDKVAFVNGDSASHTFTSELFDSKLVQSGGDFVWTATESTDYFCAVHPWAIGHISVIDTHTEPEPTIPHGWFDLPCSIQGSEYVTSGFCFGFLDQGTARADVMIKSLSTYSVENAKASGFFLDMDGNPMETITTWIPTLETPYEGREIHFTNTAIGNVTGFEMQIIGGEVVVPEPSLSVSAEIGENDYGYVPIITTFDNAVGNLVLFQVISFNGTTIVETDIAVDENHSGELYWNHIEYQPTGIYTISVSDDVTTAHTTINWVASEPEPTPEPTPQPEPTSSGTDWQGKYLKVLSDFNEVSARAGELQSKNNDLRQQIGDLEKTVDDLNAVLMEQVKVIYDWVLTK